ncbi:MAG TPA: MFS transporter [Gaiellales bacterium]|nr:MFS transporter [Gaiellales bacterium]
MSSTHPERYKWIALSNTTIGILMATINSSIVLIALPDIFRGINLNPLQPENSSYLLWMIMGFLVATAVLVVSFGRVGDIYGRVRMFTLGFAIFTVFSLLLSVTWMTGPPAAIWMIVMRIGQGVGGAFLFANSSAILTDAFPSDQRGMALGVNAVAGIAGSFIGLVVGGILGPIDWRLVFLVSVPVGLFGTVWSWVKLEERGIRQQARIDWWGNITFALGLIAVLVAITYGIQPYGGHVLGWTNPRVVGAMVAGLALLATFVVIEMRTEDPMFRLSLFRIRAFSFGNIATLLASLGRGGLMFMLIIWLQGIWLPLHGYSFDQTPLWAGVYMLPLTVGFLIAGPTSGLLSDRFGARPFATGGMLIAALSFYLLERLPVNFGYPEFAALLVLVGIGMGLFTSPNQAGIMNSLPPNRRGAGAGMATTFQNSALVLSIGIFFTLMVLGLAGSLPGTLDQGLRAQGVAPDAAQRISQLPPVGLLFSSFLGYNPMHQLLGSSINHLSAHQAAYLTSRQYFPQLIAKPFEQGLSEAFDFAIFACLTAAAASWFRGGKYVHGGEHVRPVVESGDGELAMAADGD